VWGGRPRVSGGPGGAKSCSTPRKGVGGPRGGGRKSGHGTKLTRCEFARKFWKVKKKIRVFFRGSGPARRQPGKNFAKTTSVRVPVYQEPSGLAFVNLVQQKDLSSKMPRADCGAFIFLHVKFPEFCQTSPARDPRTTRKKFRPIDRMWTT
jgi:hypothetical protein